MPYLTTARAHLRHHEHTGTVYRFRISDTHNHRNAHQLSLAQIRQERKGEETMIKKVTIPGGGFDCTEIVQDAIDKGAEEIILEGLHYISDSITGKGVNATIIRAEEGIKTEKK